MKCTYCDREATHECDFILDMRCMPMKTCDRPLCEEHRTETGRLFFCGKDGGIDTRDMCPSHAGIPGGYKPRRNAAKTSGRGRAA